MKPYYLKNAGEYHSRLTSKLAILLLALPVCGAFAAEPDYSSTLSNATTLGSTGVLSTTLSASSVTAVGTASNLNTNYIGWSVTPTEQVDLVWTSSGVALTGTAANLTVGGAVTATSTASSSYNKLSIDDYVTVAGGALAIGNGALVTGGTADENKLVNANQLANGNVVELSGAAYSSTDTSVVATTLTLTGGVTVGDYGNSNSLSITSGAKVTATGALLVGDSDENNLTSGSSNAITVSGKVTASVLGYTGSSTSTLTVTSAAIGNYGSTNAVTLSDSGTLVMGGALAVGINGSTNSLTLTGGTLTGATTVTVGDVGDSNAITATATSAITASGDVTVGNMPAATGNSISLSGSTFTGGALTLGYWGSTNAITVASTSTLTAAGVTIGLGDNAVESSSGAGDAADGTAGRVSTEGSSNTLTVTASKLVSSASVVVGVYGSSNAATFSGSSLYATWTDAIQSGATAVDGVVQLNEITGVPGIGLGTGLAAETTFGNSNSLTFSAASVFASSSDLAVGIFGSGNAVSVEGASQGSLTGGLFVGVGSATVAAQGSSNTVTLAGASALTVGGALDLGQYGSSNVVTVSGGSSLTVTGAVSHFGTGVVTTASTALKTAFGSSNVVTVTGEDSALALNGTATFVIGDYGSSNKLNVASGATATIASSVTLGKSASGNLGTILTPVRYYAEGNQINITAGAAVTFSNASTITVGIEGKSNSLTVTGDASQLDISTGTIVVGEGNSSSTAYGSNNTVTVSDGAVVLAKNLYVGSANSNYGSNNSLIVSDDAIVVIDTFLGVNEDEGDGNRIYLKDGMIAFKGKYVEGSNTWEDYIITGDYTVTSSILPSNSLVEQGLIKVWDTETGAYVTATASDLSMTYYSSESAAEEATGYKGLAGYTVLTVADAGRLAWAGDDLYYAGENVYCSSWYGWFYNDEAYGDFIMSYNNYAWQYIDPASTPDSVFLYDYSLASWLYTDQTYFQNKWFYNYSASAWQQIGL